MKSVNENTSKDWFAIFFKYTLFILGVGMFILSSIMGANIKQDGLEGIVNNLPNAFPWAIMLVLVILAYKKPELGGALVTIWGMWLFYFFNLQGGTQWLFTVIITLAFPFLGFCMMLNAFINRV